MPPIATVKDEDYIKSQKGLYILGKDVREVPCLRSSLLLGITGGTCIGLISFMATSKPAMSSHIGFASLWLVVLAYWIPCRYKYETQAEINRYYVSQGIYESALQKRDTSVVEPEEGKKE